MTHWSRMRLAPLLLLASVGSFTLTGQTGAEDFDVNTEHPRLLLKPQRLRLLRRERERSSVRWQQFDRLVAGGAQMPEPGFAWALYYQVSGNAAIGKKAVDWALGPTGSDLRQLALVFDWCQPLLSDSQASQLLAKLTANRAASADIPAMSARALAAIASSGHGAAPSRAVLETVVLQWWRRTTAPALQSGSRSLSHSDVYPLFELLHAVRDSLQIDLRENAALLFKELPAERLLSYYPAAYPAPENEYRIPFYDGKGEPDLRVATMTRIAEMSMVAYDNNAVESQFLQGWVMHDRFLLKGAQGVPYEFLWANPYQPGLSYQHMPLRFHDSRTGRLFVRSSWDDDAAWAVYAGGRLQTFQDGKIQPGTIARSKPFVIGETGLAAGPAPVRLDLRADDPSAWFIVGFSPSKVYDLEIDDEELAETRADRGGIVELPQLRGGKLSIRLHEPRGKPAL